MRIFNADETIFTSNGLKSLQPIYCHEIRNESEWYLDVRVPLSFLEYTTQDNIIVVETLDKGEQAFRIRNITVGQDIKFEARHIGYDSRVFTVALSTFVNLNPTQALTQLVNDTQTNNFTVFSNIATQLTFSIVDVPLYDALIDMARRYNAVLEFDNWQIRLVSSIGSDKGVTVAYGKNLESSSFEENWDMVVTVLYPKGNNGLVGTTLYSSIVYNRPYAKIVSFDTDDLTTLNNLASAYLSRFEKPRVNYKVKASTLSYLENVTGHNALSYFSHLFLENYNHNELSDFKYPTLVGLGDTIKVVAKQFELFTDVLSYKFNTITRKIIELEFGNYRPTIRNAIGQLRAEVVEQSRNITQLKIDEVNGEISTVVSNVSNLTGRVTNAETSITQQANQIALKADQTTVNDINTRLNTAEQRITPTAITSTVRSSTEYTNDLGAKVSTNEVISRINQTAEAIKIQADKISLEGLVTVNSRFKILADGSMEATNGVFSGNITANTGSIGRFAISGQDLVYTSELFEKDYDYSDYAKLHRLVLELDTPTAYDYAVYNFHEPGVNHFSITDLVLLNRYLSGIDPKPIRLIRSVVRIGTNNGAITTQAVAENGSVGPTTTIRGEKVNTDLINTKALSTNSFSLNGETVVGVVVDSGSNSNGRYMRFSDGTQICWHLDGTGIATSNATTPIRWNARVFTFPAAFIATPAISPEIFRSTNSFAWSGIQEESSTGCALYILSPYSTTGFIRYIAIGRWK